MARRLPILAPVLTALLLATGNATASEYPTRPITAIIQFTPGTSTDIIVRRLAEAMSRELGQPIVSVNKPGGSGTVGVAELARSKPDGYTIGAINMPALAVIPHLQTLPYDPARDIAHIAVISPYEYGLYVRADAPWSSLEEFLDYAKKNPGKVSYGSPGPGTTNHLIMVRLGKDLGINWKHVPYKGDGELIPAVLGGSVVAGVGGPAALVPHIKARKLKLLVVTSKDRWVYLPDVPTLLDKGYKYYQTSYLSLGLPGGTPEPIRQKLENTVKKVVSDPVLNQEFQEKLSARLTYIGSAEYAKLVGELSAFYRDFVREIGLKK